MSTLLILMVSYIAQIFLCRYLNLWAVKNDKDGGYIEMRPQMWFLPIIGFIGVMVYVVAVTYQIWEKTDSAKWFFGDNK